MSHTSGTPAAPGPAAAARVLAVCVVHEVLPDPGQSPEWTAIDKRPVEGRLEVGPHGLSADTQVDRKYHGGVDKAVYAYADEDVAWWAEQLGRDIALGFFGENLRTQGLDVTNAEIGERWRIGGAGGVLVEVTMPRTPCVTFQRRMQEPRWVRRFTDAGRPGAYLRVVGPGTVGAGDAVEVEHRPGHGVRISDVFPRPVPEAMRTLLAGGADGRVDLAPDMREVAAAAAARAGRA